MEDKKREKTPDCFSKDQPGDCPGTEKCGICELGKMGKPMRVPGRRLDGCPDRNHGGTSHGIPTDPTLTPFTND